MNRWLFAAAVASAVVPSAVVLLFARAAAVEQDLRARDALGDVLIDEPAAVEGIRNPLTFTESVRSLGGVVGANEVLAGPVVVSGGSGSGRRVGRLEGLGSRSSRLGRLRRAVVAGDPSRLGGLGRAAIGVDLARALDVEVGSTVRVLTLAPGAAALGHRRRPFEVAAIVRTGLAEMDGGVVVVGLEDARGVLGRAGRIDGVQARLTTALPLAESVRRLEATIEEGLRVRSRHDRDRPFVDGAAVVAAAQSTMLLALVAAFLALPLCRTRPFPSYQAGVAAVAPLAGVAILGAALAAVATVAASGDHDPWEALVAARADLGRLVLGAALGVLASPLLVGRLGRGAAGPALAVLVALGTVEGAAASLVGNGAARTAVRHEREAAPLGAAVSRGPLSAVASCGGEHVPVALVGIDPSARRAAAALAPLVGEGTAAGLRVAGAPPPPPWSSEPGLGALLDRLAATGEAVTPPTPPRPGKAAEPPGLVLGWAVARRLGATVGDRVLVATAPSAVTPDSDLDPPWPRTFAVRAILRPALRSVQGRLAIADAREVEALGGAAPPPGGVALAAPAGLAARAAAPFAARAARAARTAALQIAVLAFLAGGLAAAAPRTGLRLAGWVIAGLAAGLVLGFNEGAAGLVEIGHAPWYEVLPAGAANPLDLLSPDVLLVATTALAAAATGLVVTLGRSSGRRRDRE
jgi:ABC-type lipoprotein release transport system permease subunit